MDAAITFSLTTTSCQHKVNKSCTSLVCLDNKGSIGTHSTAHSVEVLIHTTAQNVNVKVLSEFELQ